MSNSSERRLGGEVIAAMLAAEGVDTVFGIVDGTYMGLYCSFEKHGIRLLSPRHETTAAHMAGAYSRLTGRLGVCMASNGPGVANILPGVAVENAEGNRVLLLTSSRRPQITGPDRGGAYQCFDQVGVIAAMSRFSATAPTIERIPELLRKALRAAWSGRPGIVHLDVPETVLNGTFELSEGFLRSPEAYRRTAPIPPPAEQVQGAAALLRGARRPLIHAGSGVIHAGAWGPLARAAEQLQAPVSTSWGGRSAMLDAHPLALPMWALETVGRARTEADLVLVLGARLGETDGWGRAPHWGRGQRVVQIDVDESSLGLNRTTELAILADAGAFLEALSGALAAEPVPEAALQARRAWAATLREGVRAARGQLDVALQSSAQPMHTAHVPAACQRVFGDDAVAVMDGGNTAVWANFFTEVRRPNTILSTFKFGMLGAGLGQALGAKAARPTAPVYCVLGDGAMGFHVQEIETAVRHALPVIFLVVADRQWGMVKLTQSIGIGALREAIGVAGSEPVNADLGEVAWDQVARAMGAHGERVSAPGELEPALRRCLASERAAVIHVDVDPMMHLFAPGLAEFKQLHQEPAG